MDSDITKIVGEVLTHIDTDENNETIRLTTKSGRVFLIYHSQDCCESVRVVDTKGDWHKLVGKVVVEASAIARSDGDVPAEIEYSDSWTETVLTFRTDDETVISRWIGESNGYYSESVDILEITRRDRKCK